MLRCKDDFPLITGVVQRQQQPEDDDEYETCGLETEGGKEGGQEGGREWGGGAEDISLQFKFRIKHIVRWLPPSIVKHGGVAHAPLLWDGRTMGLNIPGGREG